MLSYRHAFHAGSHADVLKHVVLTSILDRMTQKSKPLRYVETHAGAGTYSLTSVQAQLNREYEAGIGRLWQSLDAPPPVARLLALLRSFNDHPAQLLRYPGSPWLARQCLRATDRLFLHELHPRDHELLVRSSRGDRRVRVMCADGLVEAIGLVPPPERRACVFIDPSYEVRNEYRLVVDALLKAWRRFATGVYAIWYPVIDRRGTDAIERAVHTTGIKQVSLFEICIAPDRPGLGLTGSGMIVVNAPWQLADDMAAALPWLATRLSSDGVARYRAVNP